MRGFAKTLQNVPALRSDEDTAAGFLVERKTRFLNRREDLTFDRRFLVISKFLIGDQDNGFLNTF
jgi:hypothetical protein